MATLVAGGWAGAVMSWAEAVMIIIVVKHSLGTKIYTYLPSNS